MRVLLAAVLATLLGLGLRAAYAGGMPENAVVVVNADSWASMRVANEYVRLRQIPTANVIYLPGLSDFERVGIEEFRQQVLLPVLQAVKERGLDGQIDYVLYSADFPTAIGVSADVGSRKLPRIFTQDAAVNGLTYLHRFVLDKDIRYLDLNSNLYARRVLRQASDTLWTADEQHRYGEAVQQLSAVSARKSGKAQEQAKLTDEEVKAKLVSALEVMRDLKRAHPHSAELLYNLACCLALMGNADEAVAALREAAGAGWWDYRHASRDDDLKALRERADFKELLAKIKDTTFEIQPTVGFRASASERPPYLISTMLACTSGRGNSVSEALASLRRSAEADHTRPKGTIYFMENGDIRSTTREWAFRAAVEKLKQLGVNAVVEQGVLPQNKPDVAGAVIGAAGFDWAKSGSAMLPGAICEHLTSFGGALRETAGQTPLSEFLRHGAAAASGTVTEPYAIQAKFPNAFIQVHYPRGCTLGEAFYQSVNGPYQLLIVGDALCKPWATKVEVRAHGPRFEEV
ncbi:MAG: hypothetical protein FJ279_19010 [Planctomycetes bacterium]|nr:hypothetical protein [Planctomycetota bacterium]